MTDPIQPDLPTMEKSSHSVENTGISAEGKIDQLLDTATRVREELQANIRMVVYAFVGASVGLLIIFGAAAGVLWGLHGQTSKLTDIANENKTNSEIIRSTSEAIYAATGPEARAKSAIATTDVIRRNVIEGDCRMRRVQARMAAPDPASSCESQTPENIYPGIDGEPPR